MNAYSFWISFGVQVLIVSFLQWRSMAQWLNGSIARWPDGSIPNSFKSLLARARPVSVADNQGFRPIDHYRTMQGPRVPMPGGALLRNLEMHVDSLWARVCRGRLPSAFVVSRPRKWHIAQIVRPLVRD